MTYTIIGTGNMAWFLTAKLQAAGHSCNAVYGRNENNAQALARSVSAPVVNELSALPESDCYIIAVSDHAVAEVAGHIGQRNGTILHTAGSLPLNIIPHGHRAVVWPVYSITRDQIPQHRAIPVIVEADTDMAKETAIMLAKTFSDIIQEADATQRQWMHLTAVIGNNFTNHLMAICEQICTEQHIPFSVLLPILDQTFARIHHHSPASSQTGPAKRKDMAIIKAQIKRLEQHPHWQEVYRSISDSILDMYQDK